MKDVRIIVASCEKYKPIQELWLKAQKAHWPDCSYPISIISPEDDIGWNANLSAFLATVSEELILLFMDDSCLGPSPDGDYTENVSAVVRLMAEHPDIGMVKLQAGGAWPPEIHFPEWDRIREYDRRPHPFKRTNLGGPAIYRRAFLQRLSAAVLQDCGVKRDQGRLGAIEFEVTGTLLTANAAAWPERLFAIHRPDPGGNGGRSLLECPGNDAVTGGKVREIEALRSLCAGIEGIEEFL